MKLKSNELDRTMYSTLEDIMSWSGKDKAFVTKALKASSVVAAGTLVTGSKGRPPSFFLRSSAAAAMEKAEADANLVKAAQTNAEASSAKVA